MDSNITSNNSLSSLTCASKVSWIVAFSLQFLSAIIGNVLILWIVYKDNRLKTTTNYIVANMAVSDVLASIFAFPQKIISIGFDQEWMIAGNIGNLLCKMSTFLLDVSWSVSLFSLLLIAIDRYFAVAHPLKKPFENRIKYINVGVWILSSVFMLPILYFFGISDDGTQTVCAVSSKPYFYLVYLITSSVLINAVVGIGGIIAYALIVFKLYHHKVPGVQNDKTTRIRGQQNKKILKMSVSIVGLGFFINYWWVIFYVLKTQGKLDHLSPSTFKNVSNASYFITYMFYVYNFYLYLIFNDIYRENVKTIITKCSCSFQVDANNTANNARHRENQVLTEC